MDDNTKVFLGFLTGVFAGIVAGVLLAPDKGSKTRRLLADRTKEQILPHLEKANEFTKSVGDSISETIHEYTNKIFKKEGKSAQE